MAPDSTGNGAPRRVPGGDTPLFPAPRGDDRMPGPQLHRAGSRTARSAPWPGLRLALLLGLFPTLAGAETPLSAEGFESHVTGKTLTYQQYDSLFGIEEYLPGRKVRWSTAPGQCLYGSWYPRGEDICFVYEDDPDPSCWTFWLRDGTLTALASDGLPGEELHEVAATDQPLPCPGPDVGV